MDDALEDAMSGPPTKASCLAREASSVVIPEFEFSIWAVAWAAEGEIGARSWFDRCRVVCPTTSDDRDGRGDGSCDGNHFTSDLSLGRIVHEFRRARLRLDSAQLNSPEVADEPETKHRLDLSETNELSDRDGRPAIRIHLHEELSRSWRVGHATLSGCEPGSHVFRGFGIGRGR